MRLQRIIVLGALLGGIAAPALAQGDIALGEKVFLRCKPCHTIGALTGVIGRPAGSVDNFPPFGKYSDAMQAKRVEGLAWTEETLAKYLADPQGFVPGGIKKGGQPLKRPEDIANVIAYLATLQDAPD